MNQAFPEALTECLHIPCQTQGLALKKSAGLTLNGLSHSQENNFQPFDSGSRHCERDCEPRGAEVLGGHGMG